MASIINATTSTGLVTTADNSGSLQLATNNGTTALTIDTSQNVLVGATTPQGKLSTKTANVGSGSTDFETKAFSSEINFSATNKIGSLVAGYDGSIFGTAIGYSYNGAGYNMQFATNDDTTGNPIERMRINSSGNLLIGTTSTLMDSEAVLVATNTGVTQNIRCAASSGGAGIHVQRSASTGNLLYFTYTTGGTYVGQINTNGTSTSYSSASDYRLKDEITTMTAALETVAQLKPVKFKFKSDGSNGQGFIAHELQAVVPDAVVGEKDAVDVEGKPVYQGVDTSFLVATLTAAIQELNAKVEAQAVRIAELEGAK